MSELTVGVALATHNGERFLAEQLDSLARQTHLPDQLLVHDDCSHDATLDIVEHFAREAPFPVHLVRASSPLGYGRAFLDAARLCRTDLVAFCDQDDIWKPEKLRRCVAEFAARPDVTLVVHSATLLEDGSGITRRSYPDFARRQVLDPISTPILPRLHGFAMVASRRLVDPWEVVPEPAGALFPWDHDDWTATVAAALGAVCFLPDRLVLYRQHGENVWGAPPSTPIPRLRASLAYRSHEAEYFRDTAVWARDHVRVLQELGLRLDQLPSPVRRDGPRVRARLWSRLADVNERRAALYARPRRRREVLPLLIASSVRGDYGSRGHGALGLSSLARDSLYAVGLLGAVGRVVTRTPA